MLPGEVKMEDVARHIPCVKTRYSVYWSGGPGIDPRWCHWGFFPWYPNRTMCPEVDSASESEYQGFLLG